MAQQIEITNKRQRLTKLAKADPYHDFGSVFTPFLIFFINSCI